MYRKTPCALFCAEGLAAPLRAFIKHVFAEQSLGSFLTHQGQQLAAVHDRRILEHQGMGSKIARL